MIRPTGDRILVRPMPSEQANAFGIVMPKDHEATHAYGTVVAKSDAVGDHLREGTRLYHSNRGNIEVQEDGEKLVILSEMSVLGVVDDFNVMDDS